jgi:hypothetical protein
MSWFVSQTAFLVATWIAAIFGGIGIIAAFLSAIVGYQLTERSLSDANAKISIARAEARADVEKAAIEANSKIEEAKADTAKAVAETAKANERTAELKLALEREIAERQPRTISANQHAAIVQYLRNVSPKGEIVVGWKLFDEEAEQFAKQIIFALNEAGFAAKEGNGPLSFGQKGAWIIVRDLKAAQTAPTPIGAVQGAFRDILHIDMQGVPRADAFPDLGEFVVAIGGKP